MIAKTIGLRKKCEGAKKCENLLSSTMTTKCIVSVGGRASEPDKLMDCGNIAENAEMMRKLLSSAMTTKCIVYVGGRASEPDK